MHEADYSCLKFITIYNNGDDVRGHKYVFGPTQNHFSPSVARVKMSPEEGQKHIYAQEHQLYYSSKTTSFVQGESSAGL